MCVDVDNLNFWASRPQRRELFLRLYSWEIYCCFLTTLITVKTASYIFYSGRKLVYYILKYLHICCTFVCVLLLFNVDTCVYHSLLVLIRLCVNSLVPSHSLALILIFFISLWHSVCWYFLTHLCVSLFSKWV